MSRWKLLYLSAFAAFLGLFATPGTAYAVPCAEPVTFLKICCPKPCPITDPKKFVESAMKQVLEDLKLASIVKEALAWKEQLDQWGKAISSITSLINSLLGQGSSGLSAFSPPTQIPNGLSSNPLNISQTAGQLARLFSAPSSTIASSNQDQSNRSSAISDGFIEGLAVALDARNKLSSTADELKKLSQIVARGQSGGGLLSGLTSGGYGGSSTSGSTSGTSSATTSGGKDDENVRSDLAAMNQVRLAMLQALQNQTNITNAWNSTESYDAIGSYGPDNNMKKSSWGTEQSPSSAYGSLEQGIQKAEESGIGTKDAAISQRGAATQAFSDYDNLVERAVQAHNAAASYVAMMQTVALNQETIAHYEISRNMADAQRANISNGLVLFYLDPSAAFSKMATEAIGANSLGGIDPFQWGDSFAQQSAASTAQSNLVMNVVTSPGKYGATSCMDVPETDGNGNTYYYASFSAPPPANSPATILSIYQNPQRLTCGALLAGWLSMPVEPIYDQYSQTSTAGITQPDVNTTDTASVEATAKAMEELLKDNPNAGMDQSFKYWIGLQKRTVWYYDLACGATPALDPADLGACEVYNKNSNPNARAGGAQGTINNLNRSIDDMVDTLNDPEKTTVLQAEKVNGRAPLDVTSYQPLKAEIDYLISAADTARASVDPAIMAEDTYATRDADLQKALTDIRNDPTFTKWVSAAAPAEPNGQCAAGCWGAQNANWNDPVTINGFRVPTAEPSPPLPVVQHDINCSDQSDAVYCNGFDLVGVPWPVRPQTEFSPTIMVKPPYLAN